MKYRLKRVMSMAMVIIMILTSLSSAAYAATGENVSQDKLAGPIVHKLPASRIEEFDGKEAVYFGTATADLPEGDAYYSIPVYREGDLETEASVSLLTLDVSALYGVDYELCLENVYAVGNEQTLLQKGNGENYIISTDDALALADEAENAEEQEESAADVGSITRSVLSSLNINTEFASEDDITQTLDTANTDYSAGTVLHFAKGESEKVITFRVMEDELEEGQEMLMFALTDAEGTEVKQQSTFTAVINDNEELHDALLSFSAGTFCSENGKVTVTVNRTGSVYSLIDFYLMSEDDTAVVGENFIEFNELLNMQPYQTTATYTFDVAGNGKMNVVLVPNTACDTEGSNTATVLIGETSKSTEKENSLSTAGELSGTEKIDALSESAGEAEPSYAPYAELTAEELEEFGLEAEEDSHSFAITIDGNSTDYVVKYSGNARDVTVGGIYKKGFGTAAPRVGDYIFVAPKTTKFGIVTGTPETGFSDYECKDENAANNNFGHLYWYDGCFGSEGDSQLETTLTIGSSYYRYIVPEWQGLKSAGFRQTYIFNLCSGLGNLSREKKFYDSGAAFDKRVDSRFRIYLPTAMKDTKLKLNVTAGDYTEWINQVGLGVYGFVCMYKAYDVCVSGYTKKSYKTAGGGTIESIPFRLQLNAGVGHTLKADEYRTVYADTTGVQSKITFSASDVYLNGHSGQYGYISKYKMRYNDGAATSDEFKDVIYPDDFYAYLRSKVSTDKPKTGQDLLDYSSQAVEARIKKDDGRVITLSFDGYMLDWLDSLELSLKKHKDEWDNNATKLSFTPITEYFNVTVVVQDPDVGAVGKFSKLNVGTHTQYHIGDSLDLTAEVLKQGYIATGYEYTTTMGMDWTAVTNQNQLFLSQEMAGETVYIRPVMTDMHNKIRIEYIGDAEKYISVENLVDEEELYKTPYQGMNLYEVNPAKSDIYEKTRPTIGETYPITVFVTEQPQEAGYEYRPYFIDPMYSRTEHINTQVYPVIAKAKEVDNVIQIGVELVKTSELKTVTVSGSVQMKPLRNIRKSGEKPQNAAVVGYQVVGFEKQAKTKGGDDIAQMTYASTDKDGKYTLNNIKAKSGDVVPVMITGGAGGSQNGYVRVGDATSISAGNTLIAYPYLAPVMTSIMYSFATPDNNIKEDTNQTTIKIIDDAIEFQVTVDEKNTKVKNVYLIKRKYDYKDPKSGETVKGSYTEYELSRKKGESEGDSDVWTVTIPNMKKAIQGGDRLYIRIEDQDQMSLPGGKTAPIFYPVMDTGIEFYFASDAELPQDYTAALEDGDPQLDIPFFGPASTKSGATSGVITWDRTAWLDGKGYTLSINLGVGIDPANIAAKKVREEQFTKLVENQKLNAANAEKTATNTLMGLLKKREDFKNLQDQIVANRKARANEGVDFSDPKADTFEPYARVDATALISLYFVSVNGEFCYQAGAVVFGCTFLGDFTHFALIGLTPGFINWGIVIQFAYIGAWQMPSTIQGTTVASFLKQQGNIKEKITLSDGGKAGLFIFGFTGYFSPGVGKKGFVSFKGNVDFTLNVGVPTPKIDPSLKNGVLFTVGGGVEVETPVMSIKIDIARFCIGSGLFKGIKTWTFFGCLTPTSPLPHSLSEDGIYQAILDLPDGAELLDIDGNEITYAEEHRTGTTDLSSFGKGKEHLIPIDTESMDADRYSYPEILLEDAADYMQIQTVQTSDDGDLFMVFAGSRILDTNDGDSAVNAEALYYATYDASNDTWSEATILDDDNTFDNLAALSYDEDTKTVIVTWSSAEEKLTEEDTLLERLGKLRIKTVCVKLLDSGPSLIPEPWYLSGKEATSSEAKKPGISTAAFDAGEAEEIEETEETEGNEEIGENLNSKVASPSSAEKKEEDVQVEEQEAETEPAELAETAELAEAEELSYAGETEDKKKYYDVPLNTWKIGSKTYSLFTRYDLTDVETIDEVLDFSKTRPAVYLAEFNHDTGYLEKLHDLKLASGDSILMDANVERIDIEGKSILTISYTQDTDGNLQTEKDNDLMVCFVSVDPVTGVVVYPSIPINDGTVNEADGYSIMEAQINELNERYYISYIKDGYQFEIVDITNYVEGLFGSGENLSEGEFTPQKAVFNNENNMKNGITEYQLVAGDNGIYIVYTDLPEDSIEPYKELFCVKLNTEAKPVSDEYAGAEMREDKVDSYYSVPVQLTDSRRVLDNFCAQMDKDGVITVVSNGYTQTIPENGGIIFSDNKTVVTTYKPDSILRIDENQIQMTNGFSLEGAGDTVQVIYSVKNLGLEPQKGYITWAEDQNGEVFKADMRTVVRTSTPSEAEKPGEEEKKTETMIRTLSSGAEDTFSFPWNVENYGVGKTLTIFIAEKEGEEPVDEATVEITAKKELTFHNAETLYTEEGIKASLIVENTGNVDTEATSISLQNVDSDSTVLKTYGKMMVPALAPGESFKAECVFTPEWTDYTANGTINLKAQADEYDEALSFYYVAVIQKQLLIEEGKEKLAMNPYTWKQLSTTAAPFGLATDDVQYTVANPTVASVDAQGNLKAKNYGTTRVTAYSPSLGLSDDIVVTVIAGEVRDESTTTVYLPSFVDKDGTWKQDENGNWSYTTKAGVKAKDRWIAIAHATYKNGSGYEWFRFDKDGIMVTGWFRDSDDRMYYLQTISDGNKGAMYDGWHLIDGKWYYFEPVSNGYRGSLYVSRKTRDGYTVGEDGVWTGK